MLPGDLTQGVRQGEGHQEIVGGHALLQLTFEPLLAVVMLAMRTVPMTAGMGYPVTMIAVGALHLHVRSGAGTAVFDGVEGAQLRRQDLVSVLPPKVGLEGFDDGRQSDHWSFPHKVAA